MYKLIVIKSNIIFKKPNFLPLDIAQVVAKRSVFQATASMLLPALTIHTLVKVASNTFKKYAFYLYLLPKNCRVLFGKKKILHKKRSRKREPFRKRMKTQERARELIGFHENDTQNSFRVKVVVGQILIILINKRN
jgi:hypothetical protein